MLRNLGRNKLFSTINIVGLSIGMAASLMLLLWIKNEVSYDRFYPKADRLYKVMGRMERDGDINVFPSIPVNLSADLKEGYPDIESVARIRRRYAALSRDEVNATLLGHFIDPEFLLMFDIPFVSGDAHTAMCNISSIVLSAQKAKLFFGESDPIGKEILLDNDELYTVTGIMKDRPINSEFRFDYLIPWRDGAENSGRYGGPNELMIELRSGVSQAAFEEKIKDFFMERIPLQEGMTVSLFLYSVKRWHLFGTFENGISVGGRIEMVRNITLLVTFILLLACINFTTLSTARSETRSREVGMRKMLGSGKGRLIFQFLGESLVISFISGLLSIMIAHLCLSWFNTLMGSQLYMPYAQGWFWSGIVALMVVTGVLAGSYPAFFLSAMPSLMTIKKNVTPARSPINFRKALVVFQFALSLVLITYTLVVYKQLRYAQHRELGYSKENLVYLNIRGDIAQKYAIFKDEVMKTGVVEDVCLTNMPFTHAWESYGISWEEKDPNLQTGAVTFMTNGKLATMGRMQFIDGRDFDIENFASDARGCVINEALWRETGYDQPIGRPISLLGNDFQIIGVIKDFILESPYEPVKPLIMIFMNYLSPNLRVMKIRYKDGTNMTENLAITEPIFNEINPSFDFECIAIDWMYARKFTNEQDMGKLTGSSALLSVVIMCLGLFALAIYMAEKRTKEISLRKINGATTFEMVLLLVKDFLWLVTVSAVIAVPVSWWLSRRWLDKFTYRTGLEWWVFAGTVLVIAVVALLSVGAQSYRAANANPANSIKTE